jgi:simple sugar transport system permease protein
MSERRAWFPWALLALLLAWNALSTPGFFALALHDGRLVGALADLCLHGAGAVLLAVACVPLVAAGGVDLSVGSTMALCSSVFVVAATRWGVPVALLCALATGVSTGLATGACVGWLRLPALLATLVGLSAWRGAAQLVSGGGVHHAQDPDVRALGQWSLLGLPPIAWLALGFTAALHWWWTRRMVGLQSAAIGLGPRAALHAGLPIKRLALVAFAASGCAAALVGIASACELGAADASSIGVWRELDVLVALVLSGAGLSGGRVSVPAVAGGALAAEALILTLAWQGASTASGLCVRAAVLVVVLAWRERRGAPEGATA